MSKFRSIAAAPSTSRVPLNDRITPETNATVAPRARRDALKRDAVTVQLRPDGELNATDCTLAGPRGDVFLSRLRAGNEVPKLRKSTV